MLYLSAVFLAFFLAFLLSTKKGKTVADTILSVWLGVTGFHLATFYLFFSDQSTYYPTLIVTGFPLPLLQGPFLYLYTKHQTSPAPFNVKQLLHFIPFLISLLLFRAFYSLPFDQKVEIFQQKGQGFEIQMMINQYAIYISGITYITLSLITLLKFRKNLVHQFSNTERINFKWLLYLIFWMATIWIVILFIQDDEFIFGAAALFVIWLGYFGIRQVQVFTVMNTSVMNTEPTTAIKTEIEMVENNITTESELQVLDQTKAEPAPQEDSSNTKYQKSTLSDEEARMIHERLIKLMTEQKPFKNPDLTLNELAKNLEVHPNYLSQVINSKEAKTFYDLINERRVNEFIEIVSKPDNQQYTLLALAFDCGFNSKASFNRNFKKYIGQTPSEYLKQEVAA